MFPVKLSRILRAKASNILESRVKNSDSVYYEVDGIRIRLSDHPAHCRDYDLAVYYLNTHYIVIAICNNRSESASFSTKEEVLEYIETYTHYKKFFLG